MEAGLEALARGEPVLLLAFLASSTCERREASEAVSLLRKDGAAIARTTGSRIAMVDGAETEMGQQ